VKRIVAGVLICLSAGCTAVAPYQRGYLARSDMALEPAIGTHVALEKVFASKEAANGTARVGGGGCGCN
jgi:hypothetical protein